MTDRKAPEGQPAHPREVAPAALARLRDIVERDGLRGKSTPKEKIEFAKLQIAAAELILDKSFASLKTSGVITGDVTQVAELLSRDPGKLKEEAERLDRALGAKGQFVKSVNSVLGSEKIAAAAQAPNAPAALSAAAKAPSRSRGRAGATQPVREIPVTVVPPRPGVDPMRAPKADPEPEAGISGAEPAGGEASDAEGGRPF